MTDPATGFNYEALKTIECVHCHTPVQLADGRWTDVDGFTHCGPTDEPHAASKPWMLPGSDEYMNSLVGTGALWAAMTLAEGLYVDGIDGNVLTVRIRGHRHGYRVTVAQIEEGPDDTPF